MANVEYSAAFLFVVAAGLFTIAAMILGVASSLGNTKSETRKLWLIFLTEFVIVGALAVPVYLGGIALFLFVLIAGLRGQYELMSLLSVNRHESIFQLTSIAGALVIISAWFLDLLGLLVASATIFLVLVVMVPFCKAYRYSIYSLLFPVAPVVFVLLIGRSDQGSFWLLFIYLLVEVNDAFALVFGKLIGKRNLFPVLSPSKTLGGLVSGVLISGITGILVSYYVTDLPIYSIVSLVMTVIVSGIVGDLALSKIKRTLGAKDFPAVLPFHGGLLDIYDSFLFAATIFYFVDLLIL